MWVRGRVRSIPRQVILHNRRQSRQLCCHVCGCVEHLLRDGEGGALPFYVGLLFLGFGCVDVHLLLMLCVMVLLTVLMLVVERLLLFR